FGRCNQVSPPSLDVKSGLLLATATRLVPSYEEATPVQLRAPSADRWPQLCPASLETYKNSLSVPAIKRCPSAADATQTQFFCGLTAGGVQFTPPLVER